MCGEDLITGGVWASCHVSYCALQRKRDVTDSDGETTTTPCTPSTDDAKKEEKKKKKKRAKLEKTEPDDEGAEPESEVSFSCGLTSRRLHTQR